MSRVRLSDQGLSCLPTAVASKMFVTVLVILMLRSFESGHAQATNSSLFQCQSSSNQNGPVYTPNIPDFYFNDMNAANFRTGEGANLTTSQDGFTYIFTIPPESPLRNCSGTVVSLQYCYQARDSDRNGNRKVFDLLSLTQNGTQFTVDRKITRQARPQNNRCTDPNSRGIQQICCEITELNIYDRFHIPSSNFAFGVVITNVNVRPLAFTTSALEYRVEQYQAALGANKPLLGSTFTLADSSRVNGGSLLFRFFIDPGRAQTTSSSSLSQCHSSSNQNELVYTPNIPDFYFNDVNAANFRTGGGANLTTSQNRFTYIFTIPSESSLRNCSGTVVSLQYCYQARNSNIGTRARDVFDFLSLVQDGTQFTVKRKVTIQTTPQNSICTDPRTKGIQQICCDSTSLSDEFQVTSSSFTFGVEITNRNVRPLAFTNSALEYRIEQYREEQLITDPGTKFTFISSEQVNGGSLLFRFFIEPATVTTEQPTLTTQLPSTMSPTTPPTTPPPTTTTRPPTPPLTPPPTTMTRPPTTPPTTLNPPTTPTEPPTTPTEPPTTPTEPPTTPTEPPTTSPTTPTEPPTTSPTTPTEPPTTSSTTPTEPPTTSPTTPTEPPTTLPATPTEPPIFTTTSPQQVTTTTDSDAARANSSANIGTKISVAAVGGAVGGCVVVLVIIASIACVVIVLVKRQPKRTPGIQERDGMGIQNAVYEEVDSKSNSTKGFNITQPTYMSNDYAGIGPHVGDINHKCKDIQEESNEYADCGPAYELPSLCIKNPDEIEQQPSTWQDEDIYMLPAEDEDELYSQLKDISIKNLVRDSVKLGCQLGSGQFGVVYKGVLQSPELGEVDVAVKTLKEGSGEEDRVKFLQEAAIMGQFKHHNVVTMHGVVTDGEPILLVLELLTKGDLRGYLLKIKSKEGGAIGVDDHTLLSYCRQVASGMTYLSNKAFVHRDLAARNILVSEDEICKIADFGMSRDLMNESYYVSHGGQIPVKWTAPEALYYKKYSSASDVWSFGALMYEIWSVGHKPYEDYTNNKVLKLIDTGFRLHPPPGCPRTLYSIMISCWSPAPSQRPMFSDISRQLSLPDSKLLKWSEEDRAVHPEATKLGADLLCGQELYKDLQTRYRQGN